jgi:hypothetical protein
MEAESIDHVRKADALRFPDITYEFGGGPLSTSTGSSGELCLPKKTGELAFTLTTANLGITAVNLAFDFRGTPDPGGLPQIVWTVDRDVSEWASGAHITHLGGSVTTQIDSVPPFLGKSCSGDERVFQVTMSTIGTANALHIDTSVGTVDVSKIAIASPGAAIGEVLSPVFFDVGLHVSSWKKDGCGHRYQLVGAIVTITALVENLQAVGPVTSTVYNWHVDAGVVILSGLGTSTLTVRLDTPGNWKVAVDVTVATTIESSTRQGSVTFPTLTVADANTLDFACHLKHLAQAAETSARAIIGVGAGVTLGDGTRLVDPLYDPPKGERIAGLAHRVAEYQFEQLQRATRQLINGAHDLARAANRGLQDRLASRAGKYER